MHPATPENIARAACALRDGKLVAFATETVYGLGADATNGQAVARIFAAKARPSFNPLIVHAATHEAAFALGRFDAVALSLAERFWPGPLTLVVPLAANSAISSLVTAGLDTLAIRVPANATAQALLRAAGLPVAAPSANPSGGISATRAAHVAAGLAGKVDMVLDGGTAAIGLESTIVGCSGGPVRLLRPGGLARGDLEAVLGAPLAGYDAAQTPDAPGQIASHYAPRAALRMNAADVHPGEALLAFGRALPAGAQHAAAMLNLSPDGDLIEAAANLFDHLHRLDASGAACIAAAHVPQEGLGEAINDRLARAAAPRS